MWALFAAVFLLASIVCCFIADEIKNTVVAGFFWLLALVLAVGFFGCAVIALKQHHVFDKWLFSEAKYLQEIFHVVHRSVRVSPSPLSASFFEFSRSYPDRSDWRY